jgi:hypothetical protein
MMTEVERANQKAQDAFHACLVAYTETGSWDNPATDAYLHAEEDVEWEQAKEAMDSLIAADHDVHERIDLSCDECMTGYGEDSPAFWTQGELTYGFGK